MLTESRIIHYRVVRLFFFARISDTLFSDVTCDSETYGVDVFI